MKQTISPSFKHVLLHLCSIIRLYINLATQSFLKLPCAGNLPSHVFPSSLAKSDRFHTFPCLQVLFKQSARPDHKTQYLETTNCIQKSKLKSLLQWIRLMARAKTTAPKQRTRPRMSDMHLIRTAHLEVK